MARTAVAVRLRHPGPGLTEQAMPLGLAFACISRHGRAPSTMHGCSHGLPASAPASTRLTSMTVPLDAAACRPAWAGRQRTVGLRRRLLRLCCARGPAGDAAPGGQHAAAGLHRSPRPGGGVLPVHRSRSVHMYKVLHGQPRQGSCAASYASSQEHACKDSACQAPLLLSSLRRRAARGGRQRGVRVVGVGDA